MPETSAQSTERSQKVKLPGEKNPLLSLLCMAILFLGGAALGVGLAHWRAPGCFLAQALACLALPLSFVLALMLWQGFTFIFLLFRLLLRCAAREAPLAPDDALRQLRRKALLMIPVPALLCTVAGAMVGLLGSGGLFATTAIFFVVGLLYGLALYALAQNDLLPLAEEW